MAALGSLPYGSLHGVATVSVRSRALRAYVRWRTDIATRARKESSIGHPAGTACAVVPFQPRLRAVPKEFHEPTRIEPRSRDARRPISRGPAYSEDRLPACRGLGRPDPPSRDG